MSITEQFQVWDDNKQRQLEGALRRNDFKAVTDLTCGIGEYENPELLGGEE